MKWTIVALLLGTAAVSAAQQTPTLQDLQAQQRDLERKLEENQAQIERMQGTSKAQEDKDLRDWQKELQQEFDNISNYLDTLPKDLSTYYDSLHEAIGNLLDTIDEGYSQTRDAARERISAAERRYRGARETAYNQDRLHELRQRAEDLNATKEAAPLLKSLEQSIADVDKAEANSAAAEVELDRTRKAADLAGRKVELLLMQIETRQLEDSLKNSGK